MQILRGRIATLEKRVSGPVPMTIVCEFVGINKKPAGPLSCKDMNGVVWDMLPNESMMEFVTRIRDGTLSDKKGVFVLVRNR